MTSGSTCPGGRVTSLSECSTAAVALRLADTTAQDDNQSGSTLDPPYCYYEGGVLKYNSKGNNTGPCTTGDKCVCRAGTYFTLLDSFHLLHKYKIYIEQPFETIFYTYHDLC